jgi:hypothetical protein
MTLCTYITRKGRCKNKGIVYIGDDNDYILCQYHAEIVHKDTFEPIPCPYCKTPVTSIRTIEDLIRLGIDPNTFPETNVTFTVICPTCYKWGERQRRNNEIR